MIGTLGVWCVLAVAIVGCNSPDDALREVCNEQDRVTLLAETLTPETPSTPFEVSADETVWVSVIADSDFSESALFSRVTGLYLIEHGDAIAYERDELDFVLTDDVSVNFHREGQFRPIEVRPGRYQLWSMKAPVIEVVTCGTPG